MDYDYLIKILLIGDSGVGKSCILLRYSQDYFQESFITTIGIDFKVMYFNLENKRYKLQLWDTAGQERFRSITQSYFHGANALMMVFDLTDRDSFININKWLEDVDRLTSGKLPIVLLGNKSDLIHERKINYSEIKEYVEKKNILYLEVSAKNNLNIDLAFNELIRMCRENFDENKTTNTLIKLHNITEISRRKNNNCC